LRPIIKICGLMCADDVRLCVRYGTDIVGFVVDYPRPVPWNLTVQSAKELMSAVSGQSETCIVTGGSPDKILNLVSEAKPNYIQLHCGENLADTAYLVDELGKCGVKIIKTLFPDTQDLEKTAADFCKAGVYALLFDPRTPDNAATGGTADPSVYIKLRDAVKCPVILAGGITPVNVADIIRNTGAQIIDLMTGVEQSHGIKDEEKVISLFKALQNIK